MQAAEARLSCQEERGKARLEDVGRDRATRYSALSYVKGRPLLWRPSDVPMYRGTYSMDSSKRHISLLKS